ncbi:hypothetical protein [Streptomyces sp. NPDC059787]|uniref:hypothetical protein n=1 Tax=Streptomyces sp. NPDC059787 TaxID=3346947 RepID=UPI003647CE5B
MTEISHKPADNDRMSVARVCGDDILGPYEARVDRSARRDDWLCPSFGLDTVREIAARTQELAAEYGHDAVDTIHVIDGALPNGTPHAIVLHIRWAYLSDIPEETAYASEVIHPDPEGRYAIGSCEWAWHETAPAARS